MLSKSINIKEIAKRANVSIATVSRALSGNNNVTKETRSKILKIAHELNYKPNLLARSFVKGKTNIIGLILPDISDEFFSEIIKSVDDTSYQDGYFTMVISSHGNRSLVESINTMMNSRIVDGLIVLLSSVNDEIKRTLSSHRIPVVAISGDTSIGNYDIITVDNYKSSRDVVNYLFKKGYKKIAYINGPSENSDAILRHKGFCDECKKLKLTINPAWILNGDFTLLGGEEATNQLLQNKERPEVIFAANDMMAVGCYNSLAKNGYKIPDDIGVIGFDDILISEYLTPPLTTIKVDTETLGKFATEKLIDRINGNDTSKHQVITANTELVIRKSC